MKRIAATGLAGALLLAVPAPVLSQDSAPAAEEAETGNDIVVTGERDEPSASTINRQARDITDSRGDLLHSPLARIEDRLCPGVIGLKQEAAELMIDRIRWNAERLDMWLAGEDGCTPNLIIAFVEDGKAEIAELFERKPTLFQTLTIPERKALLEETGPVRVWTTAQMRTRDGMPIQRRESLDAPPVVAMWMAHSKIYLTVREDITQVVVLFDRAGVRGKTLIQLADYATMRSFARTRPADGDAPLNTVLALFDEDAAPPTGMTEFDVAYLRSLYNGIPNLRAASRINGVSRELGRVVREQAEEERE